MSSKLYGISIEFSDEIYAAPSQQVAQIMKEKHDATMKECVAQRAFPWVTLDDLLAEVIEMEDPEEHAELLAEFSYSEWKISEQDLLLSNQNDQRNLFAEGSEA